MKNQSGFTLIELSLVAVITTILVSISATLYFQAQQNVRLQQTLVEMKIYSAIAEQVRLIPGGDAFAGANTAQIGAFLAVNGITHGELDGGVAQNPYGAPYLITTINRRAGIVQTDIPIAGLQPYGTFGENVAGGSRLTMHYKPGFLTPNVTRSRWDIRNWYCVGFNDLNRPDYCPVI